VASGGVIAYVFRRKNKSDMRGGTELAVFGERGKALKKGCAFSLKKRERRNSCCRKPFIAVRPRRERGKNNQETENMLVCPLEGGSRGPLYVR